MIAQVNLQFVPTLRGDSPSLPGCLRQLVHCLPTVLNPPLPSHRLFLKKNTQTVRR